MSQYAFYLATKERMPNTKYLCWDNDHNGYELDRLFGISPRRNKVGLFVLHILLSHRNNLLINIFKAFLRLINIGIHKEDLQYAFNVNNTMPINNIVTFWFGGWHNFRYFDNIQSSLTGIFRFPIDRLNLFSREILTKIQSSNSVAIHVRRGDYIKGAHFNVFGSVCTINYYRAAIQYIYDRIDNPTPFIFSNDMEWVNDNLNLPGAIFVNQNSGYDSWMDMYLMSQCQNIIIANSTFSWWSAYLSHAHIVICPTRFINDDNSGEIYPDAWVRIPS